MVTMLTRRGSVRGAVRRALEHTRESLAPRCVVDCDVISFVNPAEFD